MPDFLYRTEDIRPSEILQYFVETKEDRRLIEAVKSRNPAILVGSRGVGKSFILRVTEAELQNNLREFRAFPVYVTFIKGTLIHTADPQQFQHWMLARLCANTIRALRKQGLLVTAPASISVLAGGADATTHDPLPIERIATQFEDSWRQPGCSISTVGLPTVDDFKNVLEDLCESVRIDRVVFLIDEAAHIFRPEQQRQFFTLFRDLRSPYLTCNAAVYPGVTAFGETFQSTHDATFLSIERNVSAADYVSNMREIVERQAESDLLKLIAQYGQNFAVLAYAANGNPRLLLKTLARASKMKSNDVNEVIREFYRTDIWSEHSLLVDKYSGHRMLIDWGRRFIENEVLPELQKKNAQYLAAEKKSTRFFWIHRDAPEPVKEALRILTYTGVVTEHSEGIKATRSEIGTRYAISLGCLLSLEANPTSIGLDLVRNITTKRMTEYGANHQAYADLLKVVPQFQETDMSVVLERQLDKSVDVLDVTDWQKECLHKLNLHKVRQVLQATEEALQAARYVGEKRSRRMKNAAIAAVYEYLSG